MRKPFFRRDSGMIGLMAIGIMLLLAATSLAMFSASGTSLAQARKGRAFVEARENLDWALADALYLLNVDATGPNGIPDGNPDAFGTNLPTTPATARKSTQNPYFPPNQRGGWSWYIKNYTDTDPSNDFIVLTGFSGRVSQTKERPLKKPGVNDYSSGVYSFPAQTLWQFSLASRQNSIIRGSAASGSTTTYGLFGNGIVDNQTGCIFPMVTYVDQAATYSTTSGCNDLTRSNITATFDDAQVDRKVEYCNGLRDQNGVVLATPVAPRWVDYSLVPNPLVTRNLPTQLLPYCFRNFNTQSTLNITQGTDINPATGQLANVAQIITDRAATIGANVTRSPGLQVHFYSNYSGSDNDPNAAVNPGALHLQGLSGPGKIDLTGFFAFVPKGECTTKKTGSALDANAAIGLTGSIVCNQIQLYGNKFGYEAPNKTSVFQNIFYTEQDEY